MYLPKCENIFSKLEKEGQALTHSDSYTEVVLQFHTLSHENYIFKVNIKVMAYVPEARSKPEVLQFPK